MTAPAATQSPYEPTLYDVMDILVRLDTRIERIEERLDRIEADIAELKLDMVDVKERLRSVERTSALLVLKVEDIQEQLDALSKAFDADAERIIVHDSRLTALETAVIAGIQA